MHINARSLTVALKDRISNLPLDTFESVSDIITGNVRVDRSNYNAYVFYATVATQNNRYTYRVTVAPEL